MKKVKSSMGVVVDRRLVRFIRSLMEWENDVYSVTLSDLDETFWFNSFADLQEFLNKQAVERFYEDELKKGYFEYVNDNGEKLKYSITKLNRGRIVDFTS